MRGAMEGGEGPPPPATTTTTTTTAGNDWGDEEKRVDDANWLARAKDGWRALREKKRERREQIESAIADASGTDGEDENEKDDDDKDDDALRREIEKENEEGKEKFILKSRNKLQTKTAAYKCTRKIRSATMQIAMIGTLCEKWERSLVSSGDGNANSTRLDDDDAEKKRVEAEELKDLCISLVSILNESVGKLRTYVRHSKEKVLGNVRVKDELIVDQKEKEQLHEKTGFKIIARCLERSETLEKRLIQSMAKLNAKNKELVNLGGNFSKITSNKLKSVAMLVVDAFTLYLKSEEQHLKNENERVARQKREQASIKRKETKAKEQSVKEDPTPVDLSSLDASTEVFKCLKCELAFQSFALRNTHMEIKHFNGVKMFFCTKCDGTFTSRTTLHRHVNKHHSQKWACKLCDPVRCFKSGYDLRMHEENQHYEEMKKRRRELGEERGDDITPEKSSKEKKTSQKSKRDMLDETFFSFVNEFFLESSDDEDNDE